ncbi:TIGR00296 family protein [Candidatus Bathyarchaeota archaeon]|nr:TIGR00296 family protein [Candidatus Bathyarchaeota archaeon]
MARLLTLEDGIVLTIFARQTIEHFILFNQKATFPESPSEALTEHRGVFVTLKKRHPRNEQKWELRGCIGHLQPGPDSHHQSISLLEATRQAALSSAFEDPRFPPVRADEMESILVETSVLTLPQEILTIDRGKLSDQITIGTDGLIVQGRGWHRGLLLPQVAPEQGWNAEEFLQGCCQKAGLPPSCYLDPGVKILKFQAQIFAESVPNGEIRARKF